MRKFTIFVDMKTTSNTEVIQILINKHRITRKKLGEILGITQVTLRKKFLNESFDIPELQEICRVTNSVLIIDRDSIKYNNF